MKTLSVVIMISILFLFGCGQKADKVTLKEGMVGFDLAKTLAEVIPAFAPGAGTVVVRADGVEVTSDEVIQAIQDNIGGRVEQLKNLDADQLKKIIEENAARIGERRLLLNAARAAGTEIPAGALESTLQQEYAGAGGEQAFLKALEESGISIDYVKRNIEESLTINKFLMDVMAARVEVTEDEVERAYQDDKTASVRHILLLTQGKSDEEKAEILKRMEGIRARAKSGEDFAELARQYTEDPGSKDNGGLYEDFGRGRMVKPFEDAAFSVPVGEISGIVETEYGYHILQVIDRKKEFKPLDEVREELESQLRQRKAPQNFIQDYVSELKEKAGFRIVGIG